MRFVRSLSLPLFVSIFVLAQQSPTPQQQAPTPQLQTRPSEPIPATPRGNERRVTVEVQVNDKSGAPVRGLQKQDFTLLDDKQPIDIVSFQAVDRNAPSSPDPPVEIILVVDAVNAGFQTVSYQRDEIRKFLLQNGGKLAEPVSLVFFTDREAKIQNDPSRDGNALAALYDQYQTGLRIVNRSQGIYGAAERFNLSLKEMGALTAYAQSRPGRKLMIWVSPGWPLLSGPRIEISAKQEQQLFDMIVQASTSMRQADVTVYSIDPLGMADFGLRTSYYEEFVKGVPFPERALPGDLGLQVLAEQTGGRALHTTNDLTTAVAKCSADAEAYYVLSFEAPKPDHANEFHSLAAKVDRSGVTARTRMGYYDEP
jgi:VWFA-related protein